MNGLTRGALLLWVPPLPWLGLALLLCASPSFATDADDICDPTDDPCLLSDPLVATPGSIIDVGERELRIVANGSITVQGGDLTLLARSVVTGTATSLRTSGRTRADVAGNLEITAEDVLLTGTIDVRGSPAGEVTIITSGNLTLSGTLRGRSEAADEAASITDLSGDVVLVNGSIDLDGGRDDTGGDLTVSGREITVSGSLNVTGGDGGTVDLAATESLLVTDSASIITRATTAAGDGGDVMLVSDGSLEVHAEVSASGRDGGEEGGGDGAQVTLGGDTSVTVGESAEIDAIGGSPDGLAGDIEVASLFGTIEIAGSIDAGSEEREGSGGSIDVSAGTEVTLTGTLQARGALGGGGDISIDAETSLTIETGSLIDASATREATAGSISLISGMSIEVGGLILATTRDDSAGGGAISFDACQVTISNQGEVRSNGSQSTNTLIAAGAISVHGELLAGSTDGRNLLRYPDEGPLPNLSGANIQPPPMLIPDSALVPCVPLPPTATPTATAMATPTPTVNPQVCPGDCNGDGMVNISELVRAVNIALGREDVATCEAVDRNSDGQVGINELIQAVNAALTGCPA